MEDFWQFAGNYWWLIFPLMGVLAAAGNAWERGVRGRHKRRLEVLKAKAELKAAQAAARGRTGPDSPNQIAAQVTGAVAAGMGAVPAQATRETQSTQLERLFAEHDAITARWLDYELDVAKIIAFPAMSDGRQPLTAAFLRAKRVADGLRPASSKAKLTREQLTEYRNAVADFEVAFDVAERDARRLRDSAFSPSERKRLETAKKLLTVAIDQASTPAERQLAYKRVREELDGLISISDEAIEVLEKKVMLELPSRPARQTPQATDASSPPPPQPRPVPHTPGAASAPAPQPGVWPVPSRTTDPGAPPA
ncbi:hypothetical protein AB1K54_16655 [Microbacterium sp. BWT-B31]|uniref:hypothetical protein n=1 Tax=Microbacterium sp. BWT-B31 TaxID=3232072 RepID=UPI003527E28F